jgi:hypothetical protein
MKAVLFIFFTLFSSLAGACDNGTAKEQAFAIWEKHQGLDSKLKYYRIYIPIKLEKMFVSSISAQLGSIFDMGLDFSELGEYEGDYYITHLGINPISESEVNIHVSYNAPYKDRSAIAFCGNFKIYKLSELLDVTPPAKRPELPPPPPPPRPESDDV